MTAKNLRLLAIFVALSLWCLPVNAATWYSVEVLIFQNLNLEGVERERWPLDPGSPDLADAVELGSGGFAEMGSGSFSMRRFASRMQGSGLYRPLLHVGWSQPGYSRTRARKVHIQNASVNGTIRISRARYLHLDVDLVLDGALVTGANVQAERFRLTADRRMRSREVHYIDHPMFGMLINIIPHQSVEPEVFDDEDTSTEQP